MAETPPLVRAVAGELEKCNRCGFCQTRCPVYRVTGRESSVARGHLARLRGTLAGEVSLDDGMRSSLFECLLCRACTAECPPAIQTDRAVVAARASYLQQGQPPLQRAIFRLMLAHPRLLRMGARLAGVAKRCGLARVAKLGRFLPWPDRGYSEGPAMMPTPGTFLRERLARRPSVSAAGAHIGYFVGCAIDCGFPEVGEATLELLEAMGHPVVISGNVCCGLPPYAYGDLASARMLARKNLAALEQLNVDTIVTDCSSCSSFLREYPALFTDDAAYAARAEAIAAKTKDLIQFLSGEELPPLQQLPAVVTHHDPCHLSRYQGLVSEPRALLRRVPGLAYRELPEADWCCGGAGSYALSHYDLSMRILQRKMENIRRTGADIVTTSCPACITQLRYGATKFEVPVEVIHLGELLRRVQGRQTKTARSKSS